MGLGKRAHGPGPSKASEAPASRRHCWISPELAPPKLVIAPPTKGVAVTASQRVVELIPKFCAVFLAYMTTGLFAHMPSFSPDRAMGIAILGAMEVLLVLLILQDRYRWAKPCGWLGLWVCFLGTVFAISGLGA